MFVLQHGFARNMDWSIVDSENIDGNPSLTLELNDDPYSHSMWDFSFQALFKVVVLSAQFLRVKLLLLLCFQLQIHSPCFIFVDCLL